MTAEVRYHPDGKLRHRQRPGPLVLHHGAFFESSRQRLEKAGVVTLDVPTTPEKVAPAAATLMQLVTSGALVHDGDAEARPSDGSGRRQAAPQGLGGRVWHRRGHRRGAGRDARGALGD